ncbi:MAG: metal-dependent hydrolase [Pseudomonadota bacterium]
MFIGHLPAGYLGLALTSPNTPWPRSIMVAGLLGAIAPDLDMFWFFLVDSSVHHHHLITHRPAVWVALLLVGAAFRSGATTAFAAGAILHCTLDTIVGSIMWAWPLSDQSFHLVTVPATRSHWILSFLTHWTFLVEIGVCVLALSVFALRRRRFR